MHYSVHVAKFVLYTLIDISNTNVTNPKNNKIRFYQAQNLNSVVQTISLRVQPTITNVIALGNVDLSEFRFGTAYKKQKVWMIEFECENPSAWASDNNPVALLVQDFQSVPIHTNLHENTAFPTPEVDTSSHQYTNTYFKCIQR